uniref:Transmembrane protein n=1 Tax=Populus trichocarpa TaxID=3694 RepID=A0A3N7G3F2_POPTR
MLSLEISETKRDFNSNFLLSSVAGNGYSSLQENNYGSDDHEHRKKLISSLKSGFLIGYVFSSVSIITIFMSYCVPWARLNKRKGNGVMIKQPMMTSLMERQEKKRKEANKQSLLVLCRAVCQGCMSKKEIRRLRYKRW